MVNPMQRIILATLFIVILLLGLCSCGATDDYGSIHKVETSAPRAEESSTPAEASVFNPQETSLHYEWRRENIGRAGLSLPCPSSWQAEKETDYDICFISPNDDPYLPNTAIYFHSTLESEAIGDIHRLYKTTFASRMLQDKYPYQGSYLQMGFSSPDKTVVNTKISDPELNYQIAVKDRDANALLRGRHETDEEMYYQANCFYWRHFPCVLTGLVNNRQADTLNDLLTYMMSNASYIGDVGKKAETVTVFPNSARLRFPLITLFAPAAADAGESFRGAEGFLCPADSGTGYSQSSLYIYEADADVLDMTLEDFEKYKTVIIRNATGIADPMTQTEGYMEYDSGYVDFGKLRAEEYVYEFTVTETKNLPRGCFAGQSWKAALYPLPCGEAVCLIAVCAPSDGFIYAFDQIRLMASGISIGR